MLVYIHVLCIDLANDNDKGTTIYHAEMLKDDDDVVSMFLWMVSKDNKLYLWVHSNCKSPNY